MELQETYHTGLKVEILREESAHFGGQYKFFPAFGEKIFPFPSGKIVPVSVEGLGKAQ